MQKFEILEEVRRKQKLAIGSGDSAETPSESPAIKMDLATSTED